MNIKQFFSVASLTAAVAGLSGCGDTVYEPAGKQQAQTGQGAPGSSAIQIESIKSGDFVQTLEDGLYKITIPSKLAGTKNDLTCLMMKDDFHAYTYSGWSCDYFTAQAASPSMAP